MDEELKGLQGLRDMHIKEALKFLAEEGYEIKKTKPPDEQPEEREDVTKHFEAIIKLNPVDKGYYLQLVDKEGDKERNQFSSCVYWNDGTPWLIPIHRTQWGKNCGYEIETTDEGCFRIFKKR